MTTENIHISNVGNSYFAIINNKAYEINKYYYNILNFIKKGYTKEDAIYGLSKQECFDEYELRLVEKSFDKFMSNLSDKQERTSYIKFSITVFHEKTTEKISKLFLFLFQKHLFISLITISVICNIFFIVYTNGHAEYKLKFSMTEMWVLFILSNIFIVFHEIGHSTASLKFKLPSKKIGFGFYFIFPVFFSDVTSIWLLEKKNRITVNIAGIYFQLVINLLFIISFFIIDNMIFKGVLSYLIMSNLFVAIYSLIPFLRNDGYWIYADLFNISNLLKKSEMLTVSFLSKSKLNEKIKNQKNAPLMLFTIANWIFKTYIIYRLLIFLINNTKKLYSNIDLDLYETIMTYLGICISIIGIYLILKNIYNLLTKNTKLNDSI